MDGTILMIEGGRNGSPPAIVTCIQTGRYLGISDTTVPPVEHHYHHVTDETDLTYRFGAASSRIPRGKTA